VYVTFVVIALPLTALVAHAAFTHALEISGKRRPPLDIAVAAPRQLDVG